MSSIAIRILPLGVVFSTLMLHGCATIVSEKRYPVTIDNAGASTYFMVHDKQAKLVHSGVTPQQVTLDAKSNIFVPAKYKVTYAGEGKHGQTRELKASVDPWIAGNIVIGGVPGLLVDGVTGAMWKLPNRVEGNVLPQYTVSDQERGEWLARREAQEQASPADSNQVIRQAAATTTHANSTIHR